MLADLCFQRLRRIFGVFFKESGVLFLFHLTTLLSCLRPSKQNHRNFVCDLLIIFEPIGCYLIRWLCFTKQNLSRFLNRPFCGKLVVLILVISNTVLYSKRNNKIMKKYCRHSGSTPAFIYHKHSYIIFK